MSVVGAGRRDMPVTSAVTSDDRRPNPGARRISGNPGPDASLPAADLRNAEACGPCHDAETLPEVTLGWTSGGGRSARCGV